MQIMRYEDYPLNTVQQEQFGLEAVRVGVDDHENRLALNLEENGLLAGDQFRSRTNTRFDDTKPVSDSNPRYTLSLTDDHEYEASIQIVADNQAGETKQLEQTIGGLTVITTLLPQLKGSGPDIYNRFQTSLTKILSENIFVYDPDKVLARDEIEGSLKLFESQGIAIPSIVRTKVLRAAGSFTDRRINVDKKREITKSRRENQEADAEFDRKRKWYLRKFGADRPSIAMDTQLFLGEAVLRNTKPGVLTVNNSWFHRDDPMSWHKYLLAQDGFEPLYGALRSPMNMLEAKTLKSIAKEPGAVIGRYSVRMEALLDIIDLARVGGDYDVLCDRLREKVFTVEEMLLSERFSEARKTAKAYKFLLRYRAEPGEQPPPEWYGGLPGISDGRYKPSAEHTEKMLSRIRR